MTRQKAFANIDDVWNEFIAARYAIALLELATRSDPTALPTKPHNIRPSHLGTCLKNLETTYLLRLFSEFEGMLRGYWATVRKVPRRTQTEALIQKIAGIRNVPGPILINVQAVREYRNQIIHHANRASGITLEEAISQLNKYITFFPLQW